MKRLSILVWAIVAVASVPAGLAAQNVTPTPPAPFSRQAIVGQLMGISFGARENPDLAFSHDQAQKLIPLLKKLKDNPALGAADTKTVWNQIQTVLTDDQKAFKPDFSNRPAGNGSWNGGGQSGQTLPPEERQARALDRLIQRLEKL